MVVHGIGRITSSLLSKRLLTQWTRGYSSKKASTLTAELRAKVQSLPSSDRRTGSTGSPGEEGIQAAAKPRIRKRRRTKPEAVAPTESKAAAKVPKLSELNTQGWSGETWKEDWGEDSALPWLSHRVYPLISFQSYAHRLR